jgi:NH3-dependent NAD+ synthetase
MAEDKNNENKERISKEELIAILFNWFEGREYDLEDAADLLSDLGYDFDWEELEDAVDTVREVLGLDDDEQIFEDEPLV